MAVLSNTQDQEKEDDSFYEQQAKEFDKGN